MKLAERLRNAATPLFTCEILPPLKGDGIQEIFDTIDRLMEFKPVAIDVTYHRQDYAHFRKADGTLERKLYRKRPGTVGICAAILHRYHVDPVPHFICGGFTVEETEDALVDLDFLGIDNLLVLQGDKLEREDRFTATNGGHCYASELLQQVVNMNQGKYLDPNLVVRHPTHFCIGVAGYCEKHCAAPDMDTDLLYLKKKVDSGAEYIVTQMFFDNQKYFQFVEKCRAIGITVPVIPGIKPLTTEKQITLLPNTFSIQLPEPFLHELRKAKNNAEVKEIGIAWCVQQCKELMKYGVPSLHFYTMGKAEPAVKILKQIF
jgi:methylenetetrahydrofolate reductase (NADPH)